MSLRDNKMLVLRQLGLESEPIDLPSLMLRLDSTVKERSVRRWLDLLVKEGVVKKIGKKRGTKYIAVGRLEKIDSEVSSCFGSASLEAIKMTKKPLFERQPIAYADDWFDSYLPNSSCYLEERLKKQLRASGQQKGWQGPAGTYAHQIFNRLIIDLSYNSSRLEGNTYTLLDTEKLVLHGHTAEGKLDEEKAMILNHKEAIRYIVDNAARVEVSCNVIYTLHYLLSDGLIEPSETGKVRKQGVRIGGSTYMPFEDPKRLELQLEKIASKAELIQDPYEQSIFLLIHISYLQAFTDVNKRTARLSANIPLIKNNLVPLAFSDIQVSDYMSAMIAVYELQDVRPLVDLYVYSYLRTCAAYNSIVKATGFDEVRVRYRRERREVVREVILQGLVGDKLNQYVNERANQLVPDSNCNDFMEDIIQDLEQIDEGRLAGLGITPEQLKKWKQ